MNLDQKLEYAKQHVRSISRHDDAPLEEVRAKLAELQEFAQAEIAQAVQRRIESAGLQGFVTEG